MGYHTKYKITEVSDKNIDTEDCENDIASSYEGACFKEEVSWYDHEEDMRDYSKNNPGILFTLHGVGEVNDDIWYKYFLNGLMQTSSAIITFEPFDDTKLK